MKQQTPASSVQVGGAHYKDLPIQPSEFCQRNGLHWCEANVVKYVARHRQKNGRQDIEKAIHYLQLLLEWEYPVVPPTGELDDEHPLWLVNAQIEGLLEGVGATEDHENVLSFLRGTGLPDETVKRMHRAMVGHDAPSSVVATDPRLDRIADTVTEAIMGCPSCADNPTCPKQSMLLDDKNRCRSHRPRGVAPIEGTATCAHYHHPTNTCFEGRPHMDCCECPDYKKRQPPTWAGAPLPPLAPPVRTAP